MGGGGSPSQSEMSRQEYSITAPGYTGELGSVLHSIMGGYSGLSKADAINDVQGVLRTQASDALQSVMPAIAKATGPAGAYDSTTKELLRNDANARINAQLEATALDAITKYAGLENQRISAFSEAAKAGTSQFSEGQTYSTETGAGAPSPFAGILGDAVGGAIRQGTQQQPADYGTGYGPAAVIGQSFADGGQVPQNRLQQMFPDNIFARTRQRQEEQAGISEGGGGITIQIDTGGRQPYEAEPAPEPEPTAGESALQAILQLFSVLGGR